MLNCDKLKEEIQTALENILPNAFEQGLKATQARQTKNGDKIAKEFAKVVTQLSAEPLAIALSSAIDFYVHNIDVYGTIITNGSSTTQMASIESANVITNGKVPNTFGIK